MAEFSLQSLIDQLFDAQHGTGAGSFSGGIGTQINQALTRFYDALGSNVSNTITDFYSDFNKGPLVDDKGFITRSQEELNKISLGLQEASNKLRPKKNKVRTQGDLYRRFQQTKREREKARASLVVGELEAKSPSVVMIDPLTGEEISTGMGVTYRPEQRLGVRNTNAWADARNAVIGKINERQGILDTEAYDAGYEYGQSLWDNASEAHCQYGLRSVYGQCRSREGAGAYVGNQRRQGVHRKAFNDFIGGSGGSLQFLQTESQSAQWMDSVYDAMADTISSTYGNFYSSSYQAMGDMINQAALLTGDVESMKKTLTEQKYAASKQKKLLDESLRGLGEIYSKARRGMQSGSRKRKAMFKGFRQSTQARPA